MTPNTINRNSDHLQRICSHTTIEEDNSAGAEEEGASWKRREAVVNVSCERVLGLQDCYYSGHHHLHFITAKQTEEGRQRVPH